MVAFVTIYFEKKNPNLTSEELTEMSFLQFGQNSKEQKGGKSILKQYSGKGWSSLLISLSLFRTSHGWLLLGNSFALW